MLTDPNVPFLQILAVAAAAVVSAHLLGLGLCRRFTVSPADVGRRIPCRTLRRPQEGGPARRFDGEVRRVLERVIRIARVHPAGLEATELAVRLDEPLPYVQAALERMRAVVPCRLQVTRQGRLIHDFEAARLGGALEGEGPGLVVRALLSLLAVGANLGAVWPVIASAVVAILALNLWHTDDENGLLFALAALFVIPLTFVATILLGVVFGGLLYPVIQAPVLAGARETSGPRGDGSSREDARIDTDRLVPSGLVREVARISALVIGPLGAVVLVCHLCGVGFVEMMWAVLVGLIIVAAIVALIEGESINPKDVVVAAVVGLLAAAVASAVAGMVLWVRGIWQSIERFREVDAQTAPGTWAATEQKPDPLGLLLPTNEAVISTLRALWHMPGQGRPPDPGLVLRMLRRAQAQGGHLSPLEVVLAEGLDPDEALAVVCSLSGQADDDVVATGAGDLDLAFREVVAERGPCGPRFEALPEGGNGRVGPGVRVNLPGLTLARIEQAERLAAGTLLFTLSIAAWQAGWLAFVLPPRPALGGWTWALLEAMTFAAILLAGLARYAARASARLGVWRDLRRATMRDVGDAATRGLDVFVVDREAGRLRAKFSDAFPGLTADTAKAIVEACCTDLDLELVPAAMVAAPDSRPYGIAPLRERLAALAKLRQEAGAASRPSGPDGVVFDTRAGVSPEGAVSQLPRGGLRR